jgi:hypothetical protein
MALERDYTAERLARIDGLLKDTKRIVATRPKSDRLLTSQLITQLDAMLCELIPPPAKPRP